MKLNVQDRLILLTVLPKEGNFTNLKLLRVAKEELSFTEAENVALNFREVGEGSSRKLIWNTDKVPDKEIELGKVVTGLVEKELQRLDKTGKLTMDHLPIYEKFFPNKET